MQSELVCFLKFESSFSAWVTVFGVQFAEVLGLARMGRLDRQTWFASRRIWGGGRKA